MMRDAIKMTMTVNARSAATNHAGLNPTIKINVSDRLFIGIFISNSLHLHTYLCSMRLVMFTSIRITLLLERVRLFTDVRVLAQNQSNDESVQCQGLAKNQHDEQSDV